MRLDELLELARDIAPADIHPQFANEPEVRLARAVVDLLGEAQPCGFEPPVAEPGMVSILDGTEDPQPAYQFTPGEARAYASMLLRAADEAER